MTEINAGPAGLLRRNIHTACEAARVRAIIGGPLALKRRLPAVATPRDAAFMNPNRPGAFRAHRSQV
jgi:hypothetical protein